MEKRKARIKWYDSENKWILELWIDGRWEFSKSWGIVRQETKSGAAVDFVSDNVLCEIAHLQDLDYEVAIVPFSPI